MYYRFGTVTGAAERKETEYGKGKHLLYNKTVNA